jgi:hypothetical protein
MNGKEIKEMKISLVQHYVERFFQNATNKLASIDDSTMMRSIAIERFKSEYKVKIEQLKEALDKLVPLTMGTERGSIGSFIDACSQQLDFHTQLAEIELSEAVAL